MGILNSLTDILGKAAKAGAAAKPAAAPPPPSSAVKSKAAALGGSTAAPAKLQPAEVEAIIEAAVKAEGVKSNWRVSIVDLMSALDLDSSLASRKKLAANLNYSGTDADGSAEKNMWLHKELLNKLAENGGKVPGGLLS